MFTIKKRTNNISEQEELSKVMTDSFVNFEYCDFGWMAECDRNKNDILLKYNNKIVGFHLFGEYSIFDGNDKNTVWLEETEIYKNKNGLQGVIMGILPEYTKMGGGTFMIEHEKRILALEYDYIWGGAYKTLNNINFWLKSRRLIGESVNSYQTIMDLK